MTILNTEMSSNVTFLSVLLVLISLGVLIYGVFTFYDKGRYSRKHLIISIVCGVCSICMIMAGALFTCKEETTIECILDDKFPVLELYENYEIVNRRGDIWVLKAVTPVSDEQ